MQDRHFGNNSYNLPIDPAQIQAEIMLNGPVEACYDIYEDFETYESGIYRHLTGSMTSSHCVKMIGWGVQDGTPYWEIANSFNTYWGEEGFFRILRGVNECGIEEFITTGLPAIENYDIKPNK